MFIRGSTLPKGVMYTNSICFNLKVVPVHTYIYIYGYFGGNGSTIWEHEHLGLLLKSRGFEAYQTLAVFGLHGLECSREVVTVSSCVYTEAHKNQMSFGRVV